MPLTVQVTLVFVVPFSVAVNCWVAPVCTVADGGDTVTDTRCGRAVIVTVCDADFVESALLVAVTVTGLGFGTITGAV
jgi:hypothetical protein